jgi:NADH:ubiquinone oxidoreductase subunit K
MSDIFPTRPAEDSVSAAYRQGRKAGLALAALALSIVAFISLLGLEKAILAGVLAIVSLSGSAPDSPARRFGVAAIVVACVYAVTFVILMVVFRDKLFELVHLLQQLG